MAVILDANGLLVPERLREAHVAHRAAYTAGPRPRAMGAGLDFFGRRKDGSEFPVDISLSPVVVKGDVLTIVSIQDLTERKQTETMHRQ